MANKGGPQSVYWALFSRKGRIRRATYGLGIALIFCIWWVVVSQLFAAREGSGQFTMWVIVLGLVALASTYCIYALCHKRLHDLGHPGHYALIIVVAGFFLSGFLVIPLVLLGVLKGQAEDNNYGPPPVQ